MPKTQQDEFSTTPRGITYSPIFRDVDAMFKWGLKPHEIESFWTLPQFIQALAIVYVETIHEWEYVKSLEANRNQGASSGKGRGRGTNTNGMEPE